MHMRKNVKKGIVKGVALFVASLLCFNSSVMEITAFATESGYTETKEIVEEQPESVEEAVEEQSESVEEAVEEQPESVEEAVEEQPESVEEAIEEHSEIVEEIIAIDEPYSDNDEEFAGYVERLMAESIKDKAGESTNAIRPMSVGPTDSFLYKRLNEFEKAIYQVLRVKAGQIAAGELDSANIKITLTREGYATPGDGSFKTIRKSFDELGVDNLEDAKLKMEELADIDNKRIHEALIYDLPYEMYWYDKTAGVSFSKNFGYGTYSNGDIIISQIIIIAKFNVSSDFCTDEETLVGGKIYHLGVDTEKTGAATKAIAEAKRVVEVSSDRGDYEKICDYRDYILDAVSYGDTSADYGNPWQLIWVFDGNASTNVVCEGYSKAFKYLCDLSDFEDENIMCLTMGGYMKGNLWSRGEGHMWNIIRMDDGENYLVDLTNSEYGTSGYGGYLFLNGYDEYKYDTSESSRSSKVASYRYGFDCGFSTVYYYNFVDIQNSYGEYCSITTDDYNLKLKEVKVEGEYSYTGEEIIPEIKVYGYGGIIIGSENYTVEVINNIAVCDREAENHPEVIVKATGDYKGEVSCAFSIDKMNISSDMVRVKVVPDKLDNAYNFSVELEYNGRILAVPEDYGYAVFMADDANRPVGSSILRADRNGKYVICIEGNGNYKGSVSVITQISDLSYIVSDVDIPEEGVPEGIWISGLKPHYSYTGAAIKPQIKVLDGNKLLTSGKDYQITYTKNINAGIAEITVKGVNDYSSIRKYTFEIDRIDIGDEAITIAQKDLYQTGVLQRPVPAVTWNGKALINKRDFAIEYFAADDSWNATGEKLTGIVNEGKYITVVRGIGNFEGTVNVKTEIHHARKPMSVLAVSSIHYQMYSKDGVKPPVTIKDGKTVLKENVDYTAEYLPQTGAGKAYIVLTGIGNYTGTRTVSFEIKGTAVSTLRIAGVPATCTYSGIGQEFEPVLTNPKTGEVLVEGTDYSLSWLKNTDAGIGTVVITGMKGYVGIVKRNFRIVPDAVTEDSSNVRAFLRKNTVPFVKSGAKPDVVVIYECGDGTRKFLSEGRDYTLVYKNNKQVSSTAEPVVEIRFKGNFKGILKRYFAITTRDIGELTALATDRFYAKGLRQNYKTSVVIKDKDGYSLTAGRDYDKAFVYSYVNDTTVINAGESINRAAGTVIEGGCINDIIPAGTELSVKIKAVANGNYTGEVTGYYKVAERKITVATVKVSNKAYTGQPVKLSASDIALCFGKTETLEEGKDYIIVEDSYEKNIKKGRAKVTIRGIGRYGGTRVITFNIVARDIKS